MGSVVNLRTVLIDIHEGCASGQTGSTTPSDGYTDDGSMAKSDEELTVIARGLEKSGWQKGVTVFESAQSFIATSRKSSNVTVMSYPMNLQKRGRKTANQSVIKPSLTDHDRFEPCSRATNASINTRMMDLPCELETSGATNHMYQLNGIQHTVES
uniref:Uncharacterized protein n=1 Tax=Panagrellus redivivus TaxID=6233 RepID=A0A7E4V799_PANRE